jgi:hypothetical protein
VHSRKTRRLTVRVPFEGESLIDVALHHVQDQPVPVSRLRPGISAATEQVVDKALAKDSAERFPSAAEMRAALERVRAAYEAQTARTEYTPALSTVMQRPRISGRAV